MKDSSFSIDLWKEGTVLIKYLRCARHHQRESKITMNSSSDFIGSTGSNADVEMISRVGLSLDGMELCSGYLKIGILMTLVSIYG